MFGCRDDMMKLSNQELEMFSCGFCEKGEKLQVDFGAVGFEILRTSGRHTGILGGL